MDRELLKGYIDLIILGIVKSETTYGYKIIKQIYKLSENNLEIKEATLYLSLKRLEKKKYVISSWGKENSYPRRKYYEITDEGKKYLNNKYDEIIKINTLIKKIMDGSV